jgi:carbon-monoxide dehydrogenase medium subunit
MFETALDEDEMITAVSFPKTGKAAYVKFPNPASRYAMVGVFVASTGAGTRVAVTGASSDGVFRHGEMESALDNSFGADSLDGIAVDADEMISDIHASGDYRAHLVREIAKRAVAAC